MTTYLILPGLGDSGPDHWQSYFERSGDNFKRVVQKEWDSPVCEDWIATLDTTIAAYNPQDIVLVAHSLGCATIAHWAARYGRKIKGAFLVAPSDPEASGYTFPATGFSPLPLSKLNFKTHVVTSENDVWVTLERAQYFADCWGSEFTNLGAAGHINVAAGYGAWPAGMELLKRLG